MTTSEPVEREPTSLGDMEPEEFRRQALSLVNWITAYLSTESRPILSRVEPGDIRKGLPSTPPETGAPFDEILSDFEKILLPGITHWNHPGFFAYFSISASAPGILAEFLTAALNVQAMLWRTSPTATELEEVSLSWLRQLLGLPSSFEGVIYDTASISTLHALAAARDVTVPNVRTHGLAGRSDVPPLRIYTSEHAHSSIDKAAITLGLGENSVRKIPADEQFRMRTNVLHEAIKEDRSKGVQPVAVVATVGTTSTTSIDPIPDIASTCKRENLWLHVDAAYAGAAALVPETASIIDGCEHADSFVVNPHKWLFTPFDLSAFYSRRMDVIRRTFTLTPDYLTTSESSVKNLMDTGVQLGRRFRALKLWSVLRYFGADGIRKRLLEHMRLAELFARWVDKSENFERLAPNPLSVVCFRAKPVETILTDEALDDLNARVLNNINATGEVFLSHTRLNNQIALRLAIGNIRTTERHVRRAWQLLNEAVENETKATP